MRWLIVEDALRDRKGHWFEYVTTFYDELRALGDEVTVLADREVEPEIRSRVNARPVLPPSIWHRMSSGNALRRLARIPAHAVATYRLMRRHLDSNEPYHIIFVPTVAVHHLLAWVWLLTGILRQSEAKVLLYFLHVPITVDTGTGPLAVAGTVSSKLLFFLVRRLATRVHAGDVILGVETRQLEAALTSVSGVSFTYIPQPVVAVVNHRKPRTSPIHMACYGEARWEKGSDTLQAAIRLHLELNPNSQTRFSLQWMSDFQNESGESVSPDELLQSDGRVEYIRHRFVDSEYANRLQTTDVMLLPYRTRSYALRGSRVAIEAMVNGIPMVATAGTALAKQAAQFGAVLTCTENDATALADKIALMERNLVAYHGEAQAKAVAARQHFSVANFRSSVTTGTWPRRNER